MSVVIKGKVVKRKKQLIEFGVITIDNTAPVNKILDDLQRQNSQAFAFYSHNIRQRRTVKENSWSYHHNVTGHPLHAFPDEWDGDLHHGYFESFPYKCLMPKMISELRNIEKPDPLTDYMKIKSDWARDVRILRKTAVSKNLLQKYESLNEEVVLCPKHIIDMAAHLDSDPDPYFDSAYNWYYSGHGNLQLTCIDCEEYLLHSELNTLYVTKFNKDNLTLNTQHEANFCCGDKILETISSTQNIVALRTMKKIFILKIISLDETLSIEKLNHMDSELPFTSVSFDNHHKNILYVVTLDNQLTIINLDRLTKRTVKLKDNNKSLVNNWSTVISSARVFYIQATKNSITIYDKRTNIPSHSWSGVRHITDDIGCNDITVVKQREGNSSLYFGTDHHLFQMDLRKICKYKPKVIQRWTHGMQSVPTYISICNFEFDKEIICLSSQWCEDMCVVTNYKDDCRTKTSGVTMPYRPPSILNTLNDAKHKCYFDLYNPIDNRLCTAITGNMIFEHGENYNILMLNSLGDISAHTLYPEHMEPFTVDTVHQLQEWAKSHQLGRKAFEVSALVDIKNILKMLKKVPEDHIMGEGKLFKDQSLKFSEGEIHKTFDSEELDSALLDVWIANQNETTIDKSASSLNLHYSFSE